MLLHSVELRVVRVQLWPQRTTSLKHPKINISWQRIALKTITQLLHCQEDQTTVVWYDTNGSFAMAKTDSLPNVYWRLEDIGTSGQVLMPYLGQMWKTTKWWRDNPVREDMILNVHFLWSRYFTRRTSSMKRGVETNQGSRCIWGNVIRSRTLSFCRHWFAWRIENSFSSSGPNSAASSCTCKTKYGYTQEWPNHAQQEFH